MPALQNCWVETVTHCPAPRPAEGLTTLPSRTAIAVIGLNVEPVG